MKKRDKDRILVEYYASQVRYERVATELHRLLDKDPAFPKSAVYTVKHRLKNTERLIEKIANANAHMPKSRSLIDHTNFQARVHDLLGFRVVCLRLTDLETLKTYLGSLADERKLKFVEGPREKKTFLVRPGDTDSTDIQYTGYSSIHYVVKLGSALHPTSEIANLRAELQLRTILEEAWGEIDHRYRYELTRTGKQVPSHIETGFRDLGLYLQAAARQADHICEEVDHLVLKLKRRKRPTKRLRSIVPPPHGTDEQSVQPAVSPVPAPDTVGEALQSILGFQPTARTLAYCQRRLSDHANYWGRSFTARDLHHALNARIVKRFREIYQEIRNENPFTAPEPSQRDLDVIPLVNFALFSTVDSPHVAEAGLRATFRTRTHRDGY